MTRALACLAAAGALLLGPAGCGGDDEGGGTAAPPVSTTTGTGEATLPPPAEDSAPEESRSPRYRRTPRSLAECVEAAPGTGEVIVKGGESEDVVFFGELAGGRVDVLGVTVDGVATELTVALFESGDAAAKAEPGAGGGGVSAARHGSALVLAPPGAETAGVEDCLTKAGYAAG